MMLHLKEERLIQSVQTQISFLGLSRACPLEDGHKIGILGTSFGLVHPNTHSPYALCPIGSHLTQAKRLIPSAMLLHFQTNNTYCSIFTHATLHRAMHRMLIWSEFICIIINENSHASCNSSTQSQGLPNIISGKATQLS